jgi:APA family basic amino acid/polyamine antiporter
MGSFWPILLVWFIGGIYALLGANSLAELGTALPQAGGFYIYSNRAFGPAVAFAVGWSDWLNNCAAIAYGSVAVAEYLAALIPILTPHRTLVALTILCLFCVFQCNGLKLSSSLQQVTSSVTALTFLVLATACLLHPAASVLPATHHALSLFARLAPVVAALRAIIVSYDGWYEAIYFTEEDINVSRNLPRAMIGGVLLILGLYLLINLAFLHVLTIPALAASTLPAADAARIVFPAATATSSAQFVTILSLLTLLSFINALLLGAPRILLAIGRDGLFSQRAAQVDAGGTPRIALLISASTAALFILSGKFEDIIAIAAILIAAMYCVNYVALIVLRIREPRMPRPFRAWGYPYTTLLVLAGSILFLIAALHDDPRSALRAAALLLIAIPVYLYAQHRRRLHNTRV